MKITMTGGSPWGFKMTGGRDFRQPLAIGPVKPGSKSDRAGVAEGHHIYSVNGEDVRNLTHLEAQNKIKAAKTTLVLELSNAPVPKPTAAEPESPTYTTPATSHAPTNKSYAPTNRPSSGYSSTNKSYASASKPASAYNATSRSYAPAHSKSVSLPLTMSTPRSPNAYSTPHTKTPSYEEPKNTAPDVEYRPVDSRDSQRRLYEELGPDWAANANQSTQQSPSMQALLRTSEYSSHDPDGEQKTLTITPEIKNMILEDEEDGRQNGHTASEGSLRTTGAKPYSAPAYNRNTHQSSPAPYSSNSSYAPPPSSSYAPPPTSSYSPPSQAPTNTKSQAIGNISKFLQTSGAKQGKPVFAKPLQDLQCPYGDPAVLEIRIGNTLPVPTVAWYHNDRPVRESREKDIKFLGKGIVHTLVLGEFAPEFSGRYRCMLTNKHGTTSCSSILSVETNPDNSGYTPAPASYNNTSRGYQPSSYQQQRPVLASNSIGLYSRDNASETYVAQTGKRPTREEPEESEVMRALREEGHVGKSQQNQSRSLRLLEETLMPESEDL